MNTVDHAQRSLLGENNVNVTNIYVFNIQKASSMSSKKNLEKLSLLFLLLSLHEIISVIQKITTISSTTKCKNVFCTFRRF